MRVKKFLENMEPRISNKELATYIKKFYTYIPSDYLYIFSEEEFELFATKSYEFIKNYKNTRIIGYEYITQPKSRTIFHVAGSNKPFIVDSIKIIFNDRNLNYEFFQHPVGHIQIDKKDNSEFFSFDQPNDSVVCISVDGFVNETTAKEIKNIISETLDQVDKTLSSWSEMLELLSSSEEIVSSNSNSLLMPAVNEAIKFLRWLKNDNFTFLGCIDYDFIDKKIITKSGDMRIWNGDENIKPILDIQNHLEHKSPVSFGKLKKISNIHRNSFIDYVLIKKLDSKGKITSARIFLGLYGSKLDYQSVKEIPILSEKLSHVLNKSAFIPKGYNAKKLKIIVESLPRTSLFHISEEELYNLCMQTLSSMSVGNLKVFRVGDLKQSFMELIFFMPRSSFTPDIHHKIHEYLQKKFGVKILKDYVNDVGQDFVFLYLTFPPDDTLNFNKNNVKSMGKDLERMICSWRDELISLIKKDKECSGPAVEYYDIFPNDYQYNYTPHDALADIKALNKLTLEKNVVFDLSEVEGQIILRLYSSCGKLSLSDTMPLLENLGFFVIEEQSYEMLSDKKHFIHIFTLSCKKIITNFKNVKKLVEDALYAFRENLTLADPLSNLITYSQISWKEIDLIRSLVHYIHQIGFAYDNNYVSETLIKHPDFTEDLIKLFNYKFNPQLVSNKAYTRLEEELKNYLINVTSSSEDKILRALIDIVNAAIRTNYFQSNNGQYKDYISIKFKSSKVPGVPKPVPFAEIFVYSKDFEAIHLRGGKVARGGLRWSDRGEDYRTEVLGLMKAQMTKNAVIVPVGSKGGFFSRFLQRDFTREEYHNKVVTCYKNFLRGLLDITDNIIGSEVIKADCVRYDDDDPYLVVAADKGTATFSDYANSVSREYNFWLGDAFASGGSAGYDHKKMAITAKGAWISVKRHFKEIGLDVQKDNITVVGIGDMSGDVFGNGLLLSKTIKLVAAFNHMHIFIDPSPDTAKSYEERKRLFRLAGSKWSDYDPKLLSAGGGIFDRKAKTIAISNEISKFFEITEKELTPEELIKYILKANADLIWNGGIGTYVKSTYEENYTIGDKTNDILRVNGSDVRAKVIGEGGNLGLSQKGRIEYARHGGRINTDFIDNSGGVDCSDHEVNIKIALGKAVEKQKITLEERDKLLLEMTDQVASLVLEDNTYQTLALSIMENSQLFTMESFARLIDVLESEKILDRKVEFIPTNQEIIQRANLGIKLTRPELAVLLSYTKTSVYNELQNSTLTSDEYFSSWLLNYFPSIMKENFKEEILNHPLRKEIILTMITNKLVNQLSGPVLSSLKKDTGALLCDIVRGFVIVQEIFDLSSIWNDVDNLSKTVSLEIVMEIYTDLNKVIRRGIAWMISNLDHPLKINPSIELYKELTLNISNMLTKNLYGSAKEKYEAKYAKYQDAGIPKSLSEKCARLESLVSSFDIAHITKDTNMSHELISKAYFKIGNNYNIDWLRKSCDKLMTESYWQRLSLQSLKDDLYDKQRRLIRIAIKDNMLDRLDKWYEKNKLTAQIPNNFIADLKIQENLDISMLILANKKLETFIRKI